MPVWLASLDLSHPSRGEMCPMQKSEVHMNPSDQWWTINGQAIMDALERVAEGDSPEIVYLELNANSDVADGEEDGRSARPDRRQR